MEKNQRTRYFDLLRIIATFLVVMLHICSILNKAETGSFQWMAGILCSSFTRCAVPVFIMISGALFLQRDISYKKIYTKYILRIVTAFLFWSTVYAFLLNPDVSVKDLFLKIIYGHFHMWFIFMIIGLYMIIPVLKVIVENEKVTKYFLALGFLLTFIIPTVVEFTQILSGPIAQAGIILETLTVKTKIAEFGGYATYFVMGYFLYNNEISVKKRRIIYIAGACGFALTVILTIMMGVFLNISSEMFFEPLSFNIALFSMAVFVFGKYKMSEIQLSESMNKRVEKLSKYCFGVYLAHPFVIECMWPVLSVLSIDVFKINMVVGIFVGSILVFLFSMILSAILNYIPFLKKYIV